MAENEHSDLRLALEAAKRDLEAEYQRKAATLDAALAILAEIGPNLQPADVAKLMPREAEAPSIVKDTETDAEEETNAAYQPESAHEEPESHHEPDVAQGRMWEDVASHNGVSDDSFVLREQVQQAIKEFRGGAFYQKDVTRALTEKFPDRTVHSGSVSNTLSKLAKRGELKIVKPARGGSDPALYRETDVSP